MITTLIILAVSAIFFALGKIRSDIVALCALISLVLTNTLTTSEALAGFSNPIVLMMAGLFVVGGAILQTGLAKMISSKILKIAGKNSFSLFLLVMITTSIIGGFISNTGTVALMLPIIVSIAAGTNTNASTLLMPLAFASSMGGMLTLIGTPPNLVIQETLAEAHLATFSFFSFLPIGVICIIVGTVVLYPLSKRFLNKEHNNIYKTKNNKDLSDLVAEYGLDVRLYCYLISTNSKLNGIKMSELDLYNKYHITIIERRKENTLHNSIFKNINQTTVHADTVFNSGDTLFLSGKKENINKFSADYNLTPLQERKKQTSGPTLEFYNIGIAELVLLPQSRLIGRLIRNTALRAKYHINVLGIRRNGNYIRENLADVQLKSSDVLLIQATWQDISRLDKEEEDWVILGQPLAEAAKTKLTHKAPIAAIIMLAMIAAMVFDFIPISPVIAVLLAAVLMILCGCFRNVEAAYKTINWESLVLIAAMMPMSVALEKTGASTLLSHWLVDNLGLLGPTMLLAGVYFTTSFLTLFISNTATAVLMAPIALSSSIEMEANPHAFLLAVTLGASMCFASPFSTPPNALVMQAGRYTFMDYIRVGLPLQIIIGLVMVLALPLIYPL